MPVKVSYSFTSLANLQGLIQYNRQASTISSNIRLALLNRSGTGLFLVYNDRRDTSASRPTRCWAARSSSSTRGCSTTEYRRRLAALTEHADGISESRQVDGEDAAAVRKAPCVDPAVVRLGAPVAERETQTNLSSIRAPLFKWPEEVVTIPTRARPPHSSSISMSARSALAATRNVTALWRSRELERVLEQTATTAGEEMPIPLDGHVICSRQHHEPDAPRVGLQYCRRREFVEEARNQDGLPVPDSLHETAVGECATNERAQSDQAAMEQAPGAAGRPHTSRLQRLERHNRGVDQGAELVGEETQPLAAARGIDRGLPASRPYSVTAPAMASSRHRFSVRKSAAVIAAFASMASSVSD